VWSDRFASRVLLVNAHDRPIQSNITLYNQEGKHVQSRMLTVPPWDHIFPILDRELMQSTPDFLSPSGIGSLVVWTRHRIPSFVAIQNNQTGVLMSFDHTMPIIEYKEPPLVN
jgi:hypothetical protein